MIVVVVLADYYYSIGRYISSLCYAVSHVIISVFRSDDFGPCKMQLKSSKILQFLFQ